MRSPGEGDFRVQNVELRYSVNGGEWKSKPLGGRGKEVADSTLMRLEKIAGEAGGEQASRPISLLPEHLAGRHRDILARCERPEAGSARPLPHPRAAVRAPLHAGARAAVVVAGSMGGDERGTPSRNVSLRNSARDLRIWSGRRTIRRVVKRKRQRQRSHAGGTARHAGRNNANTLVQRAQARGVDNADPKNKALIENLQRAVAAMQPAAKSLGDVDFPKAIPSEQKALQHLLRAEALYADLELQFRSAQSGGGGSQAGRDLAEMFELEMDLDKNQYETESRASKGGDNSPQQLR